MSNHNSLKESAANILFDPLGMEGVAKFNNSVQFFLYLHADVRAKWPITEKGLVKKKNKRKQETQTEDKFIDVV